MGSVPETRVAGGRCSLYLPGLFCLRRLVLIYRLVHLVGVLGAPGQGGGCRRGVGSLGVEWPKSPQVRSGGISPPLAPPRGLLVGRGWSALSSSLTVDSLGGRGGPARARGPQGHRAASRAWGATAPPGTGSAPDTDGAREVPEAAVFITSPGGFGKSLLAEAARSLPGRRVLPPRSPASRWVVCGRQGAASRLRAAGEGRGRARRSAPAWSARAAQSRGGTGAGCGWSGTCAAVQD